MRHSATGSRLHSSALIFPQIEKRGNDICNETHSAEHLMCCVITDLSLCLFCGRWFSTQIYQQRPSLPPEPLRHLSQPRFPFLTNFLYELFFTGIFLMVKRLKEFQKDTTITVQCGFLFRNIYKCVQAVCHILRGETFYTKGVSLRYQLFLKYR